VFAHCGFSKVKNPLKAGIKKATEEILGGCLRGLQVQA